MMVHHGQAVEMALVIRDRSSDAAMRQMALDMALTQQAQIGQMHGWLSVWDVPLTGPEPPMRGMAEQMGMASRADVNALSTLSVAEAEVSFLRLMVRHHLGGVAMAQDVLGRNPHPVVKRLADAIVESQTSEIDYMQQLLAARGTTPERVPTPSQGHH